jgi:hypothetical protein
VKAGIAKAKKDPKHPGLGRRHTLNSHQRANAS